MVELDVPANYRSSYLSARALARLLGWIVILAGVALTFAHYDAPVVGLLAAAAIGSVVVARCVADWGVRLSLSYDGVASLGRYGALPRIPWNAIERCELRNQHPGPEFGNLSDPSSRPPEPFVIWLILRDGRELPVWGTLRQNRIPRHRAEAQAQTAALQAAINARNHATPSDPETLTGH